MRYPKLRELKHAIKSFFSAPYTGKFPYAPGKAFPNFRGKPEPDDNECIACGACAEVCPARAIEVKENTGLKPATKEIIWHYDLCIFCGQCERLCTTKKGVKLSQEYDLSTFDRASLFSKVEKELLVCEDCGDIIGPKAQLLWLIRKLGPLSSGNFNLIITAQKELGLTLEQVAEPTPPPLSRGNLYKMLCPKCRHIVLVFNQTGKQ